MLKYVHRITHGRFDKELNKSNLHLMELIPLFQTPCVRSLLKILQNTLTDRAYIHHLPLAHRLILKPLHLKQISLRIKMEIVLYLTVHIFPGLIVACLCILYINFYSRGLSLCFEQEHMPYALFSFKDRQGNSETES
ncbi:uncharacterized protein [Gossypium hirsutum]|uniref:Uncharacterized protein isoform X1 n=2 Tax=Gossypium hirsutum TaxID=3635 RepID=A0ABM3AC31_GOSHI|nr:uncharacterized protein LOC107954931 isoform X1 [Gossypium hirsutum]